MRQLSVKNCFFIVVIILVISFSLNIYFALDNKKYEKKIGEKSNNEICSIKDKNEANLIMLEMVTEKGSISKKDITKLYSNYNDISKNLYTLLEEYNEYKEDRTIFNKKVVESNGLILDDIYAKGNTFILYIMENNETQSVEGTKVFKLNESDKVNFKMLYNLSLEIQKYFEDLTEKFPISGNEFKNEIINNKLWIDILGDLKKINDKYSSFTLPVK